MTRTTARPRRIPSAALAAGLLLAGLTPLAAVDRRAYIADFAAGTLSVLDLASSEPTVIATVPVGARPVAVAVDRFGERVLVSNFDDSTVSILDARATPPAVVGTVEVGPGPVGLAIAPDGSRAFVVNADDATLSVIDLTASPPVVTTTFGVGSQPEGIVVHPSGDRLYVTDSEDGAGNEPSVVWRVDLSVAPPLVAVAILVGPEAHGIDQSEDGRFLYVVSREDGALHVIDTGVEPHVVVDTIPVGDEPFLVAVDGDRAVVTREEGSAVVYDIGSIPATFVTAAAVGDLLRGLDIAGDRRVYAVSTASGYLAVLDPASDYQVVTVVELGGAPIAVGDFLAPSPGFLFADGFESGGTGRWSESDPGEALRGAGR